MDSFVCHAKDNLVDNGECLRILSQEYHSKCSAHFDDNIEDVFVGLLDKL